MLKLLKMILYPIRFLFGSGIGNIKLLNTIFKMIVYVMIPEQHIIIETNGYKLGMNIGGKSGISGLESGIILGSGYEIQNTKLFKKIVRRGMNVIDVGAHIGYYSILASKLVGDSGKVWAFEPEPHNYRNLVSNIFLNECTNIKVVGLAVSDKYSQAKLFITDNSSGECSLIEIPGRSKKTVNTDTKPLDDYMGWYFNGVKIDVIKIDVDGGEMGVLQGASNIIKDNPHIKLFIECWKPGLKSSGYSIDMFWFKLREYGFTYIYLVDSKKSYKLADTILDLLDYLRKIEGVNLFCSKEALSEI